MSSAFLTRFAVQLVYTFLFCCFQPAFGQVNVEQVNVELEQQSIGAYRSGELRADQIAKINVLIAEYSPLIANAQARAFLSDSQREARDAAILRSAASGVKGAAAIAEISKAVQLTDEQRKHGYSALQLRNEFNQAVDDSLTDKQRQLRAERPIELSGHTGYFVVRLSPNVKLVDAADKNFLELADLSGLDSLAGLLKEFGVVSGKPAVSPSALTLIDPRHAKLAKRIASYWRIDVRNLDPDQPAALLAGLRQLDAIEAAYRETRLSPSGGSFVDPDDDPYAFRQGYLDEGPAGINAKFAWRHANGAGHDVGLAVVGTSWNVAHNDFAATPIGLVYGDIKPGDHGTAALGEIIGNDNSEGIVGTAPATSYVLLSSWYKTSGSDQHIASAVITALSQMYAGDVLLLEVQRGGLPVEIDDLDFDAIRLAVAEGVIVVEPAGNGRKQQGSSGQVGFNLDEYTQPHTNKKILNRRSAHFRDSGAILVGAADPRDANNRLNFSCYGNRVDCFGWGKFVTTAGYGDLDNGGHDPNRMYTRRYHGTSSAAPILAGAALILQGLSISNRSCVLSPTEIRTILSCPDTGTLQGPRMQGHIGVMPDMERIIRVHPLNKCRCRAKKIHHVMKH